MTLGGREIIARIDYRMSHEVRRIVIARNSRKFRTSTEDWKSHRKVRIHLSRGIEAIHRTWLMIDQLKTKVIFSNSGVFDPKLTKIVDCKPGGVNLAEEDD